MSVSITELVRRYPVEVLPLQGQHEMLIWYSHHKGHNGILGRNANTILRGFETNLDLHGAEPKSYWKFRVVAPPERYAERYAEDRYRSDVRMVSSWVGTVVENEILGEMVDHDYEKRVEERHRVFSKFPGLRKCDQEPDDPDHFGCICEYGFLPAQGSWSDFYERVGMSMWASLPRTPSPRAAEPKRAPRTDLLLFDPTKPLYVAQSDFGHHNHGLYIDRIDPESCEHFGNEIFFFQGEHLEIPACFTEAVTAYEASTRTEHEKQQDRFAERTAKRRQQNTEHFAKLFPAHTDWIRKS